MFTLIFTILIVYFLWLVAKPLISAFLRRRFQQKVNDFFRQSYGDAFGMNPGGTGQGRKKQDAPRQQRRSKIFTSDVGEYVEFTEIEGKVEYTITDPSYTPREPQVSDAEWEDVK